MQTPQGTNPLTLLAREFPEFQQSRPSFGRSLCKLSGVPPCAQNAGRPDLFVRKKGGGQYLPLLPSL